MKAVPLVLAVGITIVPLVGAAQTTAPRIEARDTWTYRIIDGWNNRIERGEAVFQTVVARNGAHEISRLDGTDAGVTWRFAEPGRLAAGVINARAEGAFEPPLELRPFPLQVGQSWTQTVRRTDRSGRIHLVTVKGHVRGWESVSVPAGEFKALAIRRELFLGDRETFRSETWRIEDEWYVPELKAPIKLVVRESAMDPTVPRILQHTLINRERYELVSFSGGK